MVLLVFVPYQVKNIPPRFLVITRYESIGEVPGWVEMNPTSLPELSKPSRTLGNLQKSKFLKTKVFRKNRGKKESRRCTYIAS